MDMPNPFQALTEALEDVLGRVRCWFKPHRYAPVNMVSRQTLKSGMMVVRHTYTCTSCKKIKTVRGSKHKEFLSTANVSWDNYRCR